MRLVVIVGRILIPLEERYYPSVSTIIYLTDIPSFGATDVDVIEPYHCPEIRRGKAQDLKHAPAQRCLSFLCSYLATELH
jgi:hypothetical protein